MILRDFVSFRSSSKIKKKNQRNSRHLAKRWHAVTWVRPVGKEKLWYPWKQATQNIALKFSPWNCSAVLMRRSVSINKLSRGPHRRSNQYQFKEVEKKQRHAVKAAQWWLVAKSQQQRNVQSIPWQRTPSHWCFTPKLGEFREALSLAETGSPYVTVQWLREVSFT